MNLRYASGILCIGATMLLAACSGRQEEAARIERELMSQDTAISLSAITQDSQKPSEVAVEPSAPSDTATQAGQLTSIAEENQEHESGSDPAVVNSAMDSVLSLVAAETSKLNELQEGSEAPAVHPDVKADAMPRRTVEGKYTIQIAASASEDYALRLVDVYTQRGYDPYIDRKIIDDAVWYRVRIGHFESVGEAAAQRDELITRYSLQAWVDNIPQ